MQYQCSHLDLDSGVVYMQYQGRGCSQLDRLDWRWSARRTRAAGAATWTWTGVCPDAVPEPRVQPPGPGQGVVHVQYQGRGRSHLDLDRLDWGFVRTQYQACGCSHLDRDRLEGWVMVRVQYHVLVGTKTGWTEGRPHSRPGPRMQLPELGPAGPGIFMQDMDTECSMAAAGGERMRKLPSVSQSAWVSPTSNGPIANEGF